MATDQELINYYAGLLIVQYAGKPKAYATVQASAKPFVMNQLPLAVQNGFDLNTAIGKQLDILGKYIGISRNGNSFTGPVTLNDDDYRILLKIKTVENFSGSSLSDIQTILTNNFGTALQVFDYADMEMGYAFDASIGSNILAEVFVRDGLLPKPMGVHLKALIYAHDIHTFFKFRTYDYPITDGTSYNTYDSYSMSSPWLTYDDAIVE